MSKPLKKAPAQRKKVDFLTLLVFRDGNSPRSFRVSPSWFTRLSLIFWAVVFLAVFGWASFGMKWLKTRNSGSTTDLSSINEEMSKLRSENTELKTKLEELPKQAALPQPNTSSSNEEATPGPSTAPIPQLVPGTLPVVFSTQAQAVSTTSTPTVKIQGCHRDWSGVKGAETLKITCDLVFVGQAGGEQTGRFLVIARGASSILVYPPGSVAQGGSTGWLPPSRGEFFKVGRFRKLIAQFNGITDREGLKEVQAWIFDSQEKLILRGDIP